MSYNVGSTGVPATPTVTYTYGESSCLGLSSCYNAARLTTVADGIGSEKYAYDLRGRAVRMQKLINSTTYTTDFAYNLGNELTQITYPSGRVVQQGFDAVGRLCGVAASVNGTCSSITTPYASGFGYNTAQEVTGFNFGNGVAASLGYSSDRLQMTSLSYSMSGTSVFGLNYYYKTDSTNCSTGASGNNGQIQCVSDTVDAGRTAQYTYDALARLSTATTTGSTGYPAWGLSWTYDRYGNRTAQSILSGCTGMTCPTNSLTVSTGTNRITGSPFTYDANGNMTNDGSNTLVYNAENQIVTINSGSNEYQYDGDGVRVKKCAPNCASPSSSTVYIFIGEKVLAEYDNGAAVTSPTREYIYSGGTLLARFDGSTVKYYQQDHLSNRLTSDSTGSTLEQKAHLPFGEDWYQGGDKWKFTTYERDPESGGATGNDYGMVRYYVSRLGRFLSPDPGSIGAHLEDPQTWNGYIYAGNDPVLNTDPDGLDYYVHVDSDQPFGASDFTVQTFEILLMIVYGSPHFYLQGNADSGNVWMDRSWDDEPPLLVGDYYYFTGDGLDSHYADTAFAKYARLAGLMKYAVNTGYTVSADPNFWSSKSGTCTKEGAVRIGKDLAFVDEAKAVVDSAADGSLSPLKGLFTGGTAAEVTKDAGDYVAAHRTVQVAVRTAARSEGYAVSANAVGRMGRVAGRFAAAVGLGLTAYNGYEAYKTCMSQ